MKILYKKVLDLELWHDYYLGQRNLDQSLPDNYDISDILALVPTPECTRILQNLHWRFRPQPRGATLFAEVIQVKPGVFQTQIPVDRPYLLLFWLRVRDPRFANFTNLPFTAQDRALYYFSSRSGTQQGTTLFLTQALPSYGRNQSYQMGQLVTHQNQTWEAIRDRTSTTDEPNPEDWEALPMSQYVSQQDQRFLPEQPSTSISPEASANRWGAVEIVLQPRQSSPFSLLQLEQGQTLIRPKTFVIRFKNRSTYWRYRYNRPHGFSPDQLRSLQLQYDNETTYFTQRPQGLLQRPRRFFTDGKDQLLPAPRVTQIKPESRLDSSTQKASIAIFSDIYL
ncbi:hypothetical protein IQ250_24890 [Pseudanabaenaceae cyanobacterium LEGE 13415]|nr:hypothetical protein [Pseudanabaenaceae cyanobacterium LEGE 13415]